MVTLEHTYFVKSSWNLAGWWAVCYVNSVGAETVFAESPSQENAGRIARLLNQEVSE